MDVLNDLKKTKYDDIFFINIGCVIYKGLPKYFSMYLKKRKFKRLKRQGLLFNVCPMLALIIDHLGTDLYSNEVLIPFIENVSVYYDCVVIEDDKHDLSQKDPNWLYGPIYCCYLEYELNFMFEYLDNSMLINREWCLTLLLKKDTKIDENDIPQDVLMMLDIFKLRV